MTFKWEKNDLRELNENLIDEKSSQWMYGTLAKLEREPRRAGLLRDLADFEEKHAGIWETLIGRLRRRVPSKLRTLEHRILVSLARIFGVGSVLPIIHKQEIDGIRRYKAQAERWKDPLAQEALEEILPDEIAHEVDIFDEMRGTGYSGGALRSGILGANDGLGSILALVAGVAGATSSTPVVLIAGVAGLIAGAISMAASNFISVKAEQDVYNSQVNIQREALEVAPDAKREQLQEAYQAKGLSKAEAEVVVDRLAEDSKEFLKALMTEGRGIGRASFENPSRLALYTGVAFVLAGAIPILPFLFLPATSALLAAVGVAGLTLFVTGVLRSLSTLNSFVWSGLEMLLIGMGAAAATYLIGLAIGGFVT